MISGDYTQPLSRKQEWHLPVVVDFVTGRLYSPISAGNETFAPESFAPGNMRILVENTGDTPVQVTFNEMDDYTDSETSAELWATNEIVPRGTVANVVQPSRRYIEVAGVVGPGTIRIQIESQVHWSIMTFDKSDVKYPPILTKLPTPDPAPFPE